MKLRTTVGALLDALALTSPTLDRKGTSANLYLNANEKLGFLYLYSTNMSCETATKIKAEIETPGEVLVNPGKLADGLSGLAKDTAVSLTLTPTGNSLKVQSGMLKFSLASNIAFKELGDRMRAIPSKSEPVAIIPATELIEFTKRSVFCIPNDQTGQRINLAALKLSTSKDREEAFATDGSIVVHISSSKKQSKGDGFGEIGLLIPSSALPALTSLVAKKKGETVAVILTEKKNKVFFKFADGTHFGALIVATVYPNLKPIIDQPMTYLFDIPRELFKQSLTRASSFVPSSASKRILELSIDAENITITANGDDSLSDIIAITYKGTKPSEAVKLGMNIDHLFNITSGSHSENLTFSFSSGDKPLVVTDKEGDDEDQIDTKYVVMGVRLGSGSPK